MTNKETPLVSVIMPVYNTERYLKESLDSLLRQTYTNFELIIVNDGSTDNSADILDEYAKRDHRIKLFHRKNSGVVAAANFAAQNASGMYIMRTDSDDVSFDTKLGDLMKTAFEHPDAVLISGDIEVINEDGEYIYRHIVPPLNDEIKRAMYMYNPIANGATLIKKSAFDSVGGYSDVFAEDFHLWIKLFDKGDFVATGTTIYKWRINPNGLTMSNAKKTIDREKEYTKVLWDNSLPQIITRASTKKRSEYYYRHYKHRGAEYKKIFLSDVVRISIHLIKRGHIVKGLRQIIIVASTGRTGVLSVCHRVKLLIKGSSQALFRSIKPQKALSTGDIDITES